MTSQPEPADAQRPFHVAGTQHSVEAWSTRRLPFEPKGWLVDLRSALRIALKALDRSPTLSAVYSSGVERFCDVENVLFYNVGAAAFTGIGARAVRFERCWSAPSASPQRLDGPATHHHRYEVGASVWQWQHWIAARPLASWAGVPLVRPSTAAGWWWSMRTAGTTTLLSSATGPHLGLSVRIGGSSGAGLFNLMKTLLDGVVSAFHVHDGSHGVELAERLAGTVRGDPGRILTALVDERWDLLGRRVLVRPYRNGVQWNPADERLVAVAIESDPELASSISGELFEVEPAAHA